MKRPQNVVRLVFAILFFLGAIANLPILLTNILLLGHGRAVRVALAIAAGFMLFLFPFWWSGGALINLLFSAILARLALYEYPSSMFELMMSK